MEVLFMKKKNRKKLLVTLQTVLLRNTVFWFLWRPPIMRITASIFFFYEVCITMAITAHIIQFTVICFLYRKSITRPNLLGYDCFMNLSLVPNLPLRTMPNPTRIVYVLPPYYLLIRMN
jgi:hypothetical protein